MFILFMYLVSMNLLMIRTQEEIVIYIYATDNLDGPHSCNVTSEVTLIKGNNVSIKVRSDYFIKNSHWTQTNKKESHHHRFHQQTNSNFSITYERSISSNDKITNHFTYKYSHTQKVNSVRSGGTWNFTFELIRDYNPWTYNDENNVDTWFCQTLVQTLDPRKIHQPVSTGTQTPENIKSSPNMVDITVSREDGLIILVSLFGILLLLQTSVILYGKARRRKSKKNNDEDPISPKSPKTKRGAKPRRNIADRPPLPLPDEVVKEDKFKMEPKSSPMSPVPKRHNIFPPASAPPMPVENAYNNHKPGPLVPKQSYRNKGLDHSDDDITSPGFPRRRKEDLVPKQTYRNKPFEGSDEDLRSPGFPRRQIEAKLAQLPPKAVIASNSFKVPKPLPRSPPSSPSVKAPAFHPVHRKEPAPPLHPKNMPVFPPPAPCRQAETRLSDVDWQYEKLEPASKYLNNFSDTPYDNM